jgi:putative tryptophan/tyrosine transport system substrate-binding protein
MMARLGRRQFVVGAGAASLGLLAGCGRLPGQAQPAVKVPHIGFLAPASPESTESNPEGFRQGLAAFGYAEGQNLAVEWRFVEGQFERLPAIVAELVSLPVDVIVAAGRTIRAAQDATSTIPIVMSWAGFDPVAEGVVASLAHPGGNVTGLSSISPRLTGKRVELLKESLPAASRLVVLWDAGDPLTQSRVSEAQSAGALLGLDVQPLGFHGADDLESAFELAAKAHADGLFTVHNSVSGSLRSRIVELAARAHLPAMYENRDWTGAGGLMAYGASVAGMYHRAAYYVDRILKGAKPADLPVEQPMTFEFVVNMRTARELGITFPNEIMLQVTEVIE